MNPSTMERSNVNMSPTSGSGVHFPSASEARSQVMMANFSYETELQRRLASQTDHFNRWYFMNPSTMERSNGPPFDNQMQGSMQEARSARVNAQITPMQNFVPANPNLPSEQQMQTLPSICITGQHVSDTAVCVVCLDTYEEGETARELPCGHLFHAACIFRWFETSNNCPICRRRVTFNS